MNVLISLVEDWRHRLLLQICIIVFVRKASILPELTRNTRENWDISMHHTCFPHHIS